MAASGAPTVPDRLRAQVLADFAPVAPLPAPWRRAGTLAPVAAVMAVVAAFYWGMPRDAGASLWLLSAGQWIAGLGLLALAFREAVPGRSLDARAIGAAVTLTLVVLALNLWLADAARATVVPAHRDWRFWTLCLRGSMLLAAPVLVLATLFVARAFPVRPAVAGGLAGLAAGVLTDAGWRIGCFVSEPGHVIGAHWLAVVGSGAVGAVIAVALDARRWRVRPR